MTSPDGRENPFVPGFGTKDWKEQREIAPEKTPQNNRKNNKNLRYLET